MIPAHLQPVLGEIGLEAMARLGASRAPADQRWYWDPEWLAGEIEASAEIAAGGLKGYGSMEELFDDLDLGNNTDPPAEGEVAR